MRQDGSPSQDSDRQDGGEWRGASLIAIVSTDLPRLAGVKEVVAFIAAKGGLRDRGRPAEPHASFDPE